MTRLFLAALVVVLSASACSPDEPDAPPPPPATPTPKVLGRGLSKPWGLAVTPGNIIYSLSGEGIIVGADRVSGARLWTISGLGEPRDVKVDGTSIVFADMATGYVDVIPYVGGGRGIHLTSSAFKPDLVAVATDGYYWSELAFNGNISFAPRGGEPVETISDYESASGLTAVGDYVYWTSDTDNALYRARRGGSVETLLRSLDWPQGLTTDGTDVYWVNTAPFSQSGGSVMRWSPATRATTYLAKGQSSPTSVTVAKGKAYFTTGGGEIRSVPVGGGSVVTIATGQKNPRAIAYEGGDVLWLNEGEGATDGAVMSIRAP